MGIRRPVEADAAEFVAPMRASAALHHPWGEYPTTTEKFQEYLPARSCRTRTGFSSASADSGAIAGVININSIVRGFFQSGYLGYYVGAAVRRGAGT